MNSVLQHNLLRKPAIITDFYFPTEEDSICESSHVNSTRGSQVTLSDFNETLQICSNKWNEKVLRISASKLKWFQKYWYSKLHRFYKLLKKGLEKWQSSIFKLLYSFSFSDRLFIFSGIRVLNKMMQINWKQKFQFFWKIHNGSLKLPKKLI